jgi:glycosyltransferase involved in cell wall biosynthesis
MHILIALTYYRPHYSGLTIYVERQAHALAARGHQVTILTSRFDRSLPKEEVQDGVRIVRLNVGLHISKGVIMPAMPNYAWKLAREADVVNLHVPQFDAALIALLGRLMGKPVILTYHCDLHLPHGFVHSVANHVSNAANHIAARLSDVVVHNTLDYAEHSPFLSHYLNKLIPVYPPVELTPAGTADRLAFRQKYGIQPGQRIIGMAARLATEKGVEYLAQALPQVLAHNPQARVLVVGPYQNVVGEERYAERVMALVEPLNQHWSFLGVLSPVEMTAFFQESEVIVLPSLNSTESYGMVQVESLLCNTPVIASNLPGVRVPVNITGSGLIVPVADAQALARAILDVLEDPDRYHGEPEALIRLSSPAMVGEAYEKIFDLARDRARLRMMFEQQEPVP